MGPERSGAFAPGRINLIGEHTDYNLGLALPFAIAEGVTVRAEAIDPAAAGAGCVYVDAADLGERDEFMLANLSMGPGSRPGERGWRAFVRGTVAELQKAGFPLAGVRLEISGDVPPGAGLSSSAALEIALCLALTAPSGVTDERRTLDRIEIARLCARVESEWVGARTGLLDQLASLYGQTDMALRIDFATLQIDPVPLRLDGWRLVVLDSGERHAHASSGYNERRSECARACELLGIGSLRDAGRDAVERLPEPLRRRASHVLSENERVDAADAALRAGAMPVVGDLLNASHASLRDSYEVSTPAVEATVERLLQAGAAGARLVGGGFGGCVLGLFAPSVRPPGGAREVRPSAGAHLLDSSHLHGVRQQL